MNEKDLRKDIEDGITNKTITPPENIARYKYIGIIILILIIIIVVNHYRIKSGESNIILNVNKINLMGLIVYIIIVIVLFFILMTFQNTKNGLSDDQWDALHFIFYFFLAYFVPNSWGIILALSAAWEIFEDTMGFTFKKYSYIETDRKKIVDVLSNTSGYLLGNIFFSIPKVKRRMNDFLSKIKSK